MASWLLQHAQIPRPAPCLPVHLSAQFLVFSVTVWQCFPEVPLSHSAPIGTTQATWRQHLATPAFRGTSSGSNVSFSLLLCGKISILDFQTQTPFSDQRCPCSTAVPGLLALLLATASVEGSHHIFNWPDFACNFAFFSCPLVRKTL